MNIDLMQLVKLRSTAQSILNMFQLQSSLLLISADAKLLNKHAYAIALHNPFAVLKEIKPSGTTIWEDGVGSTVEMKDVNDASAN